MKVKELLPEAAQEILTEGSLRAIEEAFTEKLNLTVEAALSQQDELYAEKLESLIKAIDKDHTAKLKAVVEAIDRNNASKLLTIVKKYESEITEDAKKFKSVLVESISDYLEEYLNETIPAQAIEEATKNNTAMKVLENLRGVLAVDSSLMNESIQSAVVDGKQQIDSLAKQVADLTKENQLLKENFVRTKSELLLESKTKNLSEKKREYIKRVLSDKSPKFIEENFDYTLRLFEKKENEKIDILKEEAFSKRKVKTDAPILREQTTSSMPANPYVSELAKMK